MQVRAEQEMTGFVRERAAEHNRPRDRRMIGETLDVIEIQRRHRTIAGERRSVAGLLQQRPHRGDDCATEAEMRHARRCDREAMPSHPRHGSTLHGCAALARRIAGSVGRLDEGVRELEQLPADRLDPATIVWIVLERC